MTDLGLLAKRMGKTRLIAETGAGQHGVATAMVGALLDLETEIYMGADDVERQALNVHRMGLMGARVLPVTTGDRTLKDAVNEALRDWAGSFENTHYLLGTAADDPLELADHQRERVRTGRGAQKIMGVLEATRPVATRFVDGVLQGAVPGRDRYNARAHQHHAVDVERLPLDIVGAHVDFGLESEQGADHCRGDPMLAGPGLGDQAGLAHALGEQALGQHLVGFVRAAVEQILALQIDSAMPEIAAARERGRPPRIGCEERVEFGTESGILFRVEERGLELLERGQEDFGNVAAAEAAKAAIQAHARSLSLRETGRSASNSAAIFE